jgi:hypothetical protein
MNGHKEDMFLLLHPTDFLIQNIYFLEKKPNMIMDGFFTKIIFTNSFMTMNGIYLKLTIQKLFFKTPSYFLQFDVNSHKEIITRISNIEKQILLYYSMFYGIQKTPVYHLRTQLQQGSIKYYRSLYNDDKNTEYYLKISGVWENQNEIGITFKLLENELDTKRKKNIENPK